MAWPARARRAQGNFSPGSILRPTATSEWPSTRAGGIAQRRRIANSSRSSASICASGKGGRPASGPGLASSMPMEWEFTSSTGPQAATPACQARRISETRRKVPPLSSIR